MLYHSMVAYRKQEIRKRIRSFCFVYCLMASFFSFPFEQRELTAAYLLLAVDRPVSAGNRLTFFFFPKKGKGINPFLENGNSLQSWWEFCQSRLRIGSEKFTKNKYEFVNWLLLCSQYPRRQFIWIKDLEELFSYDLVMQI